MVPIAERIRRLSPLGPIFGKELRVTARRKRTYLLRFLYLGALLLVLVFFWLITRDMVNRPWNQGVAQRAQRIAELGAIFFAIFSFFTSIAMAVLGPILTSTAINSERLHKTLHVLLMTPINAWQIVSGKLFSRLLVALSLIGLSLPVLAVVRLLGGVELQQMIGVLSLCVTIALFTASIGLFFSTVMNRAYSVILLSYAFLGFLWALGPLLYGIICFGILEIRDSRFEQFSLNLAQIAHPGFSLGMLVIPEAVGTLAIKWGWCCAVYLTASALLLLWSAAILRRRARKENDGSGGASLAPVFPQARVLPPPLPAALADGNGAGAPPPLPVESAALPYAHPRRAVARKVREVSDNPVLWREVRRPLLNKLWQKIAACLVVVGTLGLFYILLLAENDLDHPDVQTAFAIVFCAVFTLLTCVVSGTAIAQEKEGDTWTLLMAAPLGAGAIVIGKLLGLLRRLAWPAALIIAHFLLFAITGILPIESALASIWIIFTTNVLWVATGLYLSLRLPNVTYAIILNLLTPVVLYAVFPIVWGIIGAIMTGDDEWALIFVFYTPYGYLIGAIAELLRPYRYGRQSNIGYAEHVNFPWNVNFTKDEFFLLTLFVGLIYLVVTALLVAWTVARFDRIVGRASQRDPLPRHRQAAALASVTPAQ